MTPSQTRFLVLASLVIVCGCQEPTTPAARQPSADPSAAKVEASLDLQVVSWDELLAQVKQTDAKVVALDIWTTTCPICVEELPQFVALEEKYDPQQAAFFTVNCDYDGVQDKPPEYYREQVEARLAHFAGKCRHVMLDVPFIDFLERIDLNSTPAVLLFNRQGQLVQRFENDDLADDDAFTSHDVAAAIDELLAK